MLNFMFEGANFAQATFDCQSLLLVQPVFFFNFNGHIRAFEISNFKSDQTCGTKQRLRSVLTPSPYGRGLGRALECRVASYALFPGPAPRGRRVISNSRFYVCRTQRQTSGIDAFFPVINMPTR